jgi:hypothetical protein
MKGIADVSEAVYEVKVEGNAGGYSFEGFRLTVHHSEIGM